jgi:hypothetical protein
LRCWRADARPDAVGADQGYAALVDDLAVAAALHGDAFDVRDEIVDLDSELERDVDRGLGGGG